MAGERNPMLKNILVPLTGFPHDSNALEAAFLVGWPFDAVIDALHVQPDPMKIVLSAAVQQFETSHSNRELVLNLQRQAAAHSTKAKEAFDRFAARHLSAHAFASAQSGVSASFRCVEGDPLDDTISTARFADIVVAGRAPEHGQFSTDQIANILVGCGRPLLLVPSREAEAIGGTIAIAWKEKAEAARAVTAAMPLLTRAKKVIVLSVEEQSSQTAACSASAEHLATQLARHGMNVEAHALLAKPHGGAGTLIEKAKELQADLVVSGAYSHSRVRELVFGGFTRSLLGSCELPVLLLH
jgi:nucleotide-binding universal stress UspA family protein